jgi:hypothetical protein
LELLADAATSDFVVS